MPAIQQDVDLENKQDSQQDEERAPTARELEMERMAEARDAVIDAEIATDVDVDNPPDDYVAPVVKIEETKVHTVKVKIDGEEREIPEEELIRGYQKNTVASQRLTEADIKQRELNERERMIAEREVQLNKQLEKPDSADTPSSDVFQEFTSALYEGDEEKTRQAFEKAIGKRQEVQPTFDLSQITQTVKQQLAQEAAMAKFLDDFKDVVANPHLVKIADEFLIEEQAAGKTYAEALQESGKRTRDWLAEVAPKPVVSARSERVIAKEGIDNLQSTSAVTSGNEDVKEESASDTIKQMRKARGLPA